jgi:A/G-specific adenine glycosylase
MISARRFREGLLRWFRGNARDLPWRQTKDPYRIWVSEIMLQQTRVAAVKPYFGRFLERFPDAASLARAPEAEVLRHWGGLGYYSRARNLHRAGKRIAERGEFPATYESIRELPGVGEYTAAAVASIAFGLPHAVVDGNVTRVLSRLTCGGESLKGLAAKLLDRADPGGYNEALMELGATVCLPREPDCPRCPVARLCEARRQGRQAEFPARKVRPATVRIAKTILLIERGGKLLLRLSQGYWELPEASSLPGVALGAETGRFRHAIMNRSYVFTVASARISGKPEGFRWLRATDLETVPLSTVTKKALALRNAHNT